MNTKLDETKTEAVPAIASLVLPVAAVKKAAVRNSLRQFAKLVHSGMVSLMLLGSGLQAPPARALPAHPPPQSERALECLGDFQGTISATPQPIPLGQAGTLRWNVTVPSICTGIGVKLYVDNQQSCHPPAAALFNPSPTRAIGSTPCYPPCSEAGGARWPPPPSKLSMPRQ